MHPTNRTLSGAAANPWLPNLNPSSQARLRLFCLPYAGGSATIYRTWASLLPPDVEVCAIQLPGRERRMRETPFTDLGPLVETLAQTLQPHLTSIPFALFGHSMGALLSYELTRELRRLDAPSPLHLFVSGHRAPQIPDPDPPVHALPEPEFIDELRQLNGTPEEVLRNPDLLQLLLPVLRADFAVCETYRYRDEPPLSCPISAFGGLQDHEVSRQDLAAWRDQTSGPFMLRMFPGDHFFLHSGQHLLLQAVAHDLWQILTRLPA